MTHEVLVVNVKSCAKNDKMSLISSATRYFDILLREYNKH